MESRQTPVLYRGRRCLKVKVTGGQPVAGEWNVRTKQEHKTLVSTLWVGIGCTRGQSNVDINAATRGTGVSHLCITQTNDPDIYFGRNKYLIII